MTINSKVVLTNYRTRAQCVIHLVKFAADTSNLNKATGIYLRSIICVRGANSRLYISVD